MPELPEVETTRRGIEPHIVNCCVEDAIVRNGSLRWPVPDQLSELVRGQVVEAVERRGKYLLLRFSSGTLLIHLGMSGSLRVIAHSEAPGKRV
jgi:formamidopyrimidine-DNA glycosylase